MPAEATEEYARNGRASGTLASQSAGDSLVVDCEVIEVFEGYGLAHVRSPEGSTYGLTTQTPGIHFADLHEGQRVRVVVTSKFSYVIYAALLGESTPGTARGR